MPELDDYSGPFKPDLTFDDFSKDFLLKLMKVWQYAWLHMTEAWYGAVKKRFGAQAANECEWETWMQVGERVNPRYAKVANIEVDDIASCLKCLQLPLDNITGGLNQVDIEIKSKNVAIVTLKTCRSLDFFEQKEPERMEWVCPMEGPIMEKYLVHPKAKATPLKLPPRNSPDEMACQWEFKIEE